MLCTLPIRGEEALGKLARGSSRANSNPLRHQHPGDGRGPTNGRFRRYPAVAGRSGEGLLTTLLGRFHGLP